MQSLIIHFYSRLIIDVDVLAQTFGNLKPPATIKAATLLEVVSFGSIKDPMYMFVVWSNGDKLLLARPSSLVDLTTHKRFFQRGYIDKGPLQ